MCDSSNCVVIVLIAVVILFLKTRTKICSLYSSYCDPLQMDFCNVTLGGTVS